MFEKIRPWAAMMFCVVLSLITIVANLYLASTNGVTQTGVESGFYCFLPMCFFFVCDFMSNLRKENLALRTRIDELSSQLLVKNPSA